MRASQNPQVGFWETRTGSALCASISQILLQMKKNQILVLQTQCETKVSLYKIVPAILT